MERDDLGIVAEKGFLEGEGLLMGRLGLVVLADPRTEDPDC